MLPQLINQWVEHSPRLFVFRLFSPSVPCGTHVAGGQSPKHVGHPFRGGAGWVLVTTFMAPIFAMLPA